MGNKAYDNLIVSSAPHLVSPVDTSRIMGAVLLALIPSLGVSTYVFGHRVLSLTLVCMAACVAFEYLFNVMTKRTQTISDLSAMVTGVLLAFNLPSNLSYLIAVIGCFVAIVIVKGLFGGLGQNVANPAITARIVLFLSFTTQMNTWPLPRALRAADAVTGPTPLGILKEGNGVLPSNLDMFSGVIGGSMGEVSAVALLLGGIFLIWRQVISPIIPVSFIATVAVLALAAGQDPIFHITAGGVMIGAFFMATDYATSPRLPLGKLIFGVGCGCFTMLIRVFGSYPEGVSFAILLMNIITPHIDNFCERRLLGGGEK
ncbi:RnfABCDGE type electron transport complex subunit D [Aminipila butyrica]|uniref:Ion-translocating oxidoreductase complex subunit D n=1 Tax=Aminipila butyrica TaxID=433296 RepID=A0A858BSA6_9FIRM|nr:RnfABCDGE type electron transport complex subunit D [Aminipila butyrica]QIB67840.1 RnfABCDGE type electron transport complex subunit D [Aminipila butyrica]